MRDASTPPTTPSTPCSPDDARAVADRGSMLAIAMVIIVVFATLALAVASYASASLRGATITRDRLQSLSVAEGAMRIALEDIRLPRTVGDGQTTNNSTTLTSAAAGFRASDAGKGISGSGIPAGTTIAAVVDSSTITLSAPATATASNVFVSYGNAICGPTSTTILTTTIDGTPVTAKCVRQPSIPGEFARPAIVITGADGLELGEDTNRVLGDIYFTQPSTITLEKNLVVENGNVWYPAATCPGTKPSLAKLTFDRPNEFTYLCVASGVADKYSDIFPVPVISAVPTTAPAPKVIGPCTIFYPGRYTAANKPDLDGTKEAYFKSGVYYFDDLGEVKVKDTRVTGGQPGDSAAAAEEESIFNPNCKATATGGTVNDSGRGVTIVLGGTSRFKIEDKGGLELYAPNNGYSVVAYANATNGYNATTGGTSSDPLINQTNGGSMLRVHGSIWAPTGYVALGEQTKAEYTDGGEVATGGQLFGGIVVMNLRLLKKAPDDGYNVQVDVVDGQYRVLTVTTAGIVSVRTVADVRPSSEELAVRSWRASTTVAAATLPTPPGVPIMVSRPALASGSDTGTLDDNITSLATPTLTGSASPGSIITLYADGEVAGTGVAVAGTYTITASELSEGLHEFTAAAVNPGFDDTESQIALFTVDLTSPAISTGNVAIAPIGNPSTGGFLKQGGQYYVYANASDASGIAGITANVSNLTTGQTAAALESGDFTLGGVAYQWRSAALTANASLSAGAKTYTATATDHSGRTGSTAAASVVVDNTAPTGSVTSPAAGAIMVASQSVTATASDANGVASVEFQYRQTGTSTWLVIGTDSSNPYEATWDTSLLLGAQYDLRVVVTDQAANTFASAVVVVNGHPPDAPSTPVLAPASDSGVLGDLVTNDDTPTFTGTAVPGTTVKIYDGATQRGSAVAAVDGTWSITTNAMSQSSHDITATSTSTGGLVSNPTPVIVVVIDKTDPTIVSSDIIIARVGNTTSPGWIKQGGQYYVYAKPSDAGSGIGTVTANVNNFTTGSTAVPLAAGSWVVNGVTYGWRSDVLTVNAGLSAGARSFNATATDVAGNPKTSPNTNAEVDNTNPTGGLTAPTNGAVVPAFVTVSSNSNDNKSVGDATYEYSVSGANTWVTIGSDTSSPYSLVWDAGGLTHGGAYDLRVVTSDSAGNTLTSATHTVTLDTVAPAAPSAPALAAASDTGVVGDSMTRMTTPTLTGTAEPGATVKLYEGATLLATTTATGGNWSVATSALTHAAHTITATATDAAGNVSPASAPFVVTVDTTAPTVMGAVMANGSGELRKIDQGDTATLTFSENLIASTWCSTWTSNSEPSNLTDVTLTVVQDGSDDYLVLTSPTCTLSLGFWDTRGDYVSNNSTFLNSTLTWNPTNFTLTLTIGTYSSGTIRTNVNTEKMEYTPTAARTDIAGNAMSTSRYASLSETGF